MQEIRGIVKIEGPVEVTGSVKVEGRANVESLLKRGWFSLKDGEWDAADTFFDRVLDINPENGNTYAGKLCSQLHYCELSEISQRAEARHVYWNALISSMRK